MDIKRNEVGQSLDAVRALLHSAGCQFSLTETATLVKVVALVLDLSEDDALSRIGAFVEGRNAAEVQALFKQHFEARK